jgi:hypothetical protein
VDALPIYTALRRAFCQNVDNTTNAKKYAADERQKPELRM